PLEGAEHAGGPALFPYRVLRWYAVMWVVIFTVAANVPQLATLRRQLVFNEGVMTLVPLLLIAAYRLPWREALAVRAPAPLAWLAALLAGPSGNITAIGLYRLASLVIP